MGINIHVSTHHPFHAKGGKGVGNDRKRQGENITPTRCRNSSKSLWGRVSSCRVQVETDFITRECQTFVEQVRRDCLARFTIVDREMNETKPLSHVQHFRQLHVGIGSTVLSEVVAT